MQIDNLRTSLHSQGSSATSESGVYAESITTASERQSPSLRHAVSFGKPPSWSGSITLPSSSNTASSKGKHALESVDSIHRPFLSLLFDRDDYLLPTGEGNEESDYDEEIDARAHFRLPSQELAVDNAAGSKSGSDVPRSRTQPPRTEQYERSINVTHLTGRQQIVGGIRVHPNFNLSNTFGNLTFSSSVRTNNYPSEIQDAQVDNIFLPTWAMMTVNTRPDPGSLRSAFLDVQNEAKELLNSGAPTDLVLEKHPNLGALWDETEFNRSGILSRWAAGMVHSVRLKGELIVQVS